VKLKIEWKFKFEKWGDFDSMKYVPTHNLQPYKEDHEQVIVFILVLKLMSQVGVVCNIFKSDDALHLQNIK
jgi:hypothetical protein